MDWLQLQQLLQQLQLPRANDVKHVARSSPPAADVTLAVAAAAPAVVAAVSANVAAGADDAGDTSHIYNNKNMCGSHAWL